MRSVVICGSRRFKPQIRTFAQKLKDLGVVVFEPYLHSGQQEWENMSPPYQRFIALGLTHDHFYKIAIADVVYLYNPDGYSGVSTTMELGAAVALHKPVYAYSVDDPELCRRVLIREAVTIPEQLLTKL